MKLKKVSKIERKSENKFKKKSIYNSGKMKEIS